jgi:hypothetical protein
VLTRAAIRSSAETFWAAAGGRAAYGSPVRIASAVVHALPIAIHRVAGLTTHHIGSILARAGALISIQGDPRPLRGCLVADVGVGLMLVDDEDSKDEQRLTVAHETAHFLLHYLALRDAALTGLGRHVIAVLDRTRSPTQPELFSSALRDLPLSPFRHALARNGVHPSGRAATMEAEADDLAIELLAPWALIRSLNSPDAATISSRFGLPLAVATRLVSMAARPTTEVGVTRLFGIK